MRLEQTAAQIAALQAKLDGANEAEPSDAGAQAAAALALASLTRTVDAGAPFADELSVLARLAGDSSSVESLRAHARTGAPTLSQLKERFDPFARAAIAAASRENATGILGGLKANLEELVSVRPSEYTEGDDAPAVISRAEDSLRKDDLAQSLAYLEELDGAAAAAFEPWIADARSRMAVGAAIATLNDALLSALDE